MRLALRHELTLPQLVGTTIAGLIAASACTRLDSPNDTFGDLTARAGGGNTDAGTPGHGGAAIGGALLAGSSGYGKGLNQAGSASGNPARGTQAGSGGASGTTNGIVAGKAPVASSGASGSMALAGAAGAAISASAAGSTAQSCWDPNSMRGLGCYRCTPKDLSTFENACTMAQCVAFGNSQRLVGLIGDGTLPRLPADPVAAGGTGEAAGSNANGGSTGAGGRGGAGIAGDDGTSFAGASTISAGGSSSTSGAPSCEDLSAKGSLVYVVGSSAAKPFLQQIAQQLAVQSVFVVYVAAGSCVGVDAVLNRTLIRTGPAPLPATTATYWDGPATSGKPCTIGGGGVLADIGVSDVFAQTCPGFELSSLDALQVKDAHGPVQTMAFVVPTASNYTEISAQAAYLVFGFGNDGHVLDPSGASYIWNDESFLFIRSATSGTQAMLASAIGVPPDRWKGRALSSSDAVVNAVLETLSSPESANKTIGILAADYIESKSLRAQLRALAFQDTNQNCAFYPDSTATARDKRNVRDGHYPLWGPLHLLYRIDVSGSPENLASRQSILDILGYLSGSKSLPNGVRLMDVYAQSGLVPECAMRVTRTKDGGNLAPYAPSSPCSCLFELTTTGATSCRTCTVQGDCTANQSCSLGYCEELPQ